MTKGFEITGDLKGQVCGRRLWRAEALREHQPPHGSPGEDGCDSVPGSRLSFMDDHVYFFH